MTNHMICPRSFFKGILAMYWPHDKVNYAIDWKQPTGDDYTWIHLWTPIWHEGRGPYISIGIWFGIGTLEIMRGY